jgi:hypothetical protein
MPEMNTPSSHDKVQGEALRERLREALAQPTAGHDQVLEGRILEQWRQRTAAQVIRSQGPLAVLQVRWRQHPALWSSTLLALGLVIVLMKPWVQPDPALDELLQLDVLSLMAAGQL